MLKEKLMVGNFIFATYIHFTNFYDIILFFFKNGASKLHRELVKILNGISVSELTWDNPLASQMEIT